jgi:hypothetical protein
VAWTRRPCAQRNCLPRWAAAATTQWSPAFCRGSCSRSGLGAPLTIGSCRI